MFIRTVERDSTLDAFRAEVRDFCERELPTSIRHKQERGQHLEKPEYDAWLKKLGGKGWLTGKWPKQHGGLGWSPEQSMIFSEELGRAGAPPITPFGVTMAGPVIYTFGTEAQKAQHLPGIMKNDFWWCQGYSEPGAGSDLAGLKTKAVRDGDHYVVNGQKIWTSLAHWADWIFCLVRTDGSGKKQDGISFLLIDMKTPGITVRPIIAITLGHHLNEVFFDLHPRSSLLRRSSHFGYEGRTLRGIRRRRINLPYSRLSTTVKKWPIEAREPANRHAIPAPGPRYS